MSSAGSLVEDSRGAGKGVQESNKFTSAEALKLSALLGILDETLHVANDEGSCRHLLVLIAVFDGILVDADAIVQLEGLNEGAAALVEQEAKTNDIFARTVNQSELLCQLQHGEALFVSGELIHAIGVEVIHEGLEQTRRKSGIARNLQL